MENMKKCHFCEALVNTNNVNVIPFLNTNDVICDGCRQKGDELFAWFKAHPYRIGNTWSETPPPGFLPFSFRKKS